jgi:hypothetical protein
MDLAEVAKRAEQREQSLRELEDEVATLASHLYAGTCRFLELVGELDRRGQWMDCSCAQWLAWRCGLLPRAAREHVRVARRLPELPVIHAAFARGELSYSKVRALTRIADPQTEEDLLAMGRALTASQLERAVRAAGGHDRGGERPPRRRLPDHVLERRRIAGDPRRLAPEDGAVVLRALDAARDQLWEGKEGGSAEPPSSAETLVAVAEAALTSAPARAGGERYQVVVHVDADTLAGDDGGGCALDDEAAVAPETARRLACDASVVTMSERNGRLLSVGRKTRSIPPALRRALLARDGRCRFPGCDNRLCVDGHHIEHWVRGGATNLDNLLLLCRRHHRLVHEGGYSVDQEGRFYDPWGQRVPPVPNAPPGDAEQLLRHDHARTIGPRTCASECEHMDLELQVEALAAVLYER